MAGEGSPGYVSPPSLRPSPWPSLPGLGEWGPCKGDGWMAEVLPGPGTGATHIGHDLELPHIDQLGGQQLPKRFLLVAKLSAHLLGWGQHWFS